MRPLMISLFLLLSLCSSAQQTASFQELLAKMQHLKEKYTGQSTDNDRAVTIIMRKLSDDYQGRLSLAQYKQLSANLQQMQEKTDDHFQRQQLSEACQLLHGKSDTLDIEQRILDYYARVPQEVIYIHNDRPYYVPGDTVWFRAHLVDAVTHTPISRSKYVYVELLDNAADTLVQRIIVRCDSDGVFANALTLPPPLHDGTYTLAAYTQWMRNFPAERFCYHSLRVVASSPRPGSESDRLGLSVRPVRTLRYS